MNPFYGTLFCMPELLTELPAPPLRGRPSRVLAILKMLEQTPDKWIAINNYSSNSGAKSAKKTFIKKYGQLAEFERRGTAVYARLWTRDV